jgi:hypothetical protein
MNNQQQYFKKQFEKYIESVILPSFPEIVDYEVEEWMKGLPDFNYEFSFYFNDWEDVSREHEIEDYVRGMIESFSIETILYGVNFRVKK